MPFERKPFFWNSRSIVGLKRDRRLNTEKGCKKRKCPKWTHTFVCLSKRNQDVVPDSDERAVLQMASLGEQRISLLGDAGCVEIYNELHFHFPKLKTCGGFEMLRMADSGSKLLQVIAAPSNGYTIPYLRAVVHNAKIYLRPLQKDLDDSPSINEESSSSPPKESCLCCGKLLDITRIREHMETCSKKTKVLVPDSESDEGDFVPTHLQETSPVTVSDSDSDDAALQMAIQISKQEISRQEASCGDTDIDPKSIDDIVRNLKKEVGTIPFDMVIRRGFVLQDTLRRVNKITFDPTKLINVEFVGEEGIDTGGPTREYFRLLFQQVSETYLEYTGCFKHNAVAYQDNVYFHLGQLASMCLVQGGAAIHILCPSVFSFFCGMNPSDIVAQIEEVPDREVQEFLNRVVAVHEVQELRSLLESSFDVVVESGFTKPLIHTQLEDKTNIVQTITLHYVILRSLGELHQFRDGLASLHVADALKHHGELLRSFFTNEKILINTLTADSLRKMFTNIVYSEKGSNERSKEENAYIMFLDYLEKCERVSNSVAFPYVGNSVVDEGKVSLEMVLSFFTGATEIPPLGFPNNPQLNFSPTSPYPTASTCAIELTLPTMYRDSVQFDKKMDQAFLSHGGFGLK